MNFDERFEQSEYSLEELESFRDEQGFIDLSRAGITLTDKSREFIGNQDRIKNWINFNGTKVMIKGEALFEGEENYGIYAELIIEEIAKRFGIPAAHYDLVKIQGPDGNVVHGVLSVSIVDKDKDERLESLHALIGDEPPNSVQQTDTTGFDYTVEKLEEVLLKEGFSEEYVKKRISDYKKRTAFFIRTADADKHTENVAWVRGKDENGNPTIELAPVFDSESALLMDISKSTIEKLRDNGIAILQTVNGIYPRIAVCKDIEDGGIGELWPDTLEALTEDDEMYEYVSEMMETPIDMDEVFESIERRINAKLPMQVKEISRAAFSFRGDEMYEVLDGSYLDSHQKSKVTGNSLLDSLIGKSTKSVGTDDISFLLSNLGLQMNFGNKDDRVEKTDEEKLPDDG